MACAGDVPTLETLAAVDLLRQELPDLRIRVVNVVDLMTLQPKEQHPHGIGDKEFDAIFTCDKPVIFAYHATTKSQPSCVAARRPSNVEGLANHFENFR